MADVVKDRRTHILDTLDDSVTDFLYYGRKEDEDLPMDAIQEAVVAGEITVTEMVLKFESCLRRAFSWEENISGVVLASEVDRIRKLVKGE